MSDVGYAACALAYYAIGLLWLVTGLLPDLVIAVFESGRALYLTGVMFGESFNFALSDQRGWSAFSGSIKMQNKD